MNEWMNKPSDAEAGKKANYHWKFASEKEAPG